MKWLQVQTIFLRVFPTTELVLAVLAYSSFVPRILAFNPKVVLANVSLQPPVISRAQSQSGSDARVEALFGQAQQAQSRGDYRSAAASYQEALKLRPHFAEARTNLGLMYHLLGDHSQAVVQFKLAVREKPQLVVPNLFLGLDLLELHEPHKALEHLQRAWRLVPRDERIAAGLGQAYAALREFQLANDWYFRAAEINPKDSEALYGLGITYLNLQRDAAGKLGAEGQDSLYDQILLGQLLDQQGRVGDAINLYRKLLKTNTRWPGLRTALGFDYIRQEQIAEAKSEFQDELSQNPGFLLARLGLARISFEKGDGEACMKALAEIWGVDRNFLRANTDVFLSGLTSDKIRAVEDVISENNSGTPPGEFCTFLKGRLAELRQGLSDATPSASKDEALSAEERALLNRTSASDLYQKGRYSLCKRKLELSLEHLGHSDSLLLSQCSYYSGNYRTSFLAAGHALTMNPADLEALYWRAAAGSKLAVQTLFDAGRADPNSFRVHLLLGEAYRTMNKYQTSESEYRKALELKPRDPAAHLGLATLYWQAKNYDKALPEVKDALAGRQGDPEASYLMGDILVARHQYSEAQPYVAAALGASGKTAFYAHALLGKIYASQDQTATAIVELRQALPGDDDGSFHFQIYQLFKKIGDEKAAAAALRDSEAIRQRQAEGIRAAIERNE